MIEWCKRAVQMAHNLRVDFMIYLPKVRSISSAYFIAKRKAIFFLFFSRCSLFFSFLESEQPSARPLCFSLFEGET